MFVCQYVAPPGQHSIMLQLFFIVKCGIAHFLCTMRVFEVRTSSSPLGYLCAKFRFFHGLQCWASPCRKSHTQSLTQYIWCPGDRSVWRIFKIKTVSMTRWLLISWHLWPHWSTNSDFGPVYALKFFKTCYKLETWDETFSNVGR